MTKILDYKKTLIVAALMLAGGVGFFAWRASSEAVAIYREAVVTRGDIEVTVLATGIVQPRNRIDIKPPIAGRVEEVLVREGQLVARGAVLAWMSSSERAALTDAARAKGPEELKRWEELYRPTPIVAPIAGMVILRNAEPGQTFQSQEAMFVMSDRLTVKAQVDETDIARVRLRQGVRITLDAYPDENFSGVVDEIAFDAKTVNNVTTYEVDVLPQAAPAFLRSGMTANVSFVMEAKRDVLVVPAEAVRSRGGRSWTLVPAAEGDGAPHERDVKLGLSDGRRTEVLAGLLEGDKVLVPQMLKPGKPSGSSPLSPFGRR